MKNLPKLAPQTLGESSGLTGALIASFDRSQEMGRVTWTGGAGQLVWAGVPLGGAVEANAEWIVASGENLAGHRTPETWTWKISG